MPFLSGPVADGYPAGPFSKSCSQTHPKDTSNPPQPPPVKVAQPTKTPPQTFETAENRPNGEEERGIVCHFADAFWRVFNRFANGLKAVLEGPRTASTGSPCTHLRVAHRKNRRFGLHNGDSSSPCRTIPALARYKRGPAVSLSAGGNRASTLECMGSRTRLLSETSRWNDSSLSCINTLNHADVYLNVECLRSHRRCNSSGREGPTARRPRRKRAHTPAFFSRVTT